MTPSSVRPRTDRRVPSISWTKDSPDRSMRDLGGPRLTHHGDPDLAGIGQLVLDLLGDLAGDDLGGEVVDLGRLDHDPHLAAGLHSEYLLHAGLGRRDLFDAGEPLDVG